MIPVTSFAGKNVAVFGLGGSGLASAQALVAGGADVIAFDDNAASIDKAAQAGIATANLRDLDWSKVSALLLAPGVPLTHPAPHWSVGMARAAGVEVIGDVELFCRERRRLAPDSPFVAITGTNGKSTTTALIHHLLVAAGRSADLGGNIGTAVLTLAPPRPGHAHVVECSSYQIDLAPSLDPRVGVLINVSEDHLDRHGTLEHYAAVKERLVAGVQPGGAAIVGVDDDWCEAAADRIERKGDNVVRISVRRPLADGIYVETDQIMRAAGGTATRIARLGGIGSLRGLHNAQNAACAAARCWRSGSTPTTIQNGLRSFPGLAHRMEQVGRKGAVLFVNDSKATNADSAAQALACFSDIFWIAGGKPKTGGIASLEDFFPRIRKAYLIGEAAADFAKTLDGKVPYEIVGTLDRAVEAAARDAAAAGPGAGGAAVAGLRLVRPVSEFRGARHGLPRPGAGAAGIKARPNQILISWKPCRVSKGRGFPAPRTAMVSRTERTPFGDWWWTIDRVMLAAIVVLMLGGIILSLAASPPVAARLNLDAFHFVNRHIMFLVPTLAVLLVTSLLSPRQIRRVALVVFLVSPLLVAVTPFFGAEIKGARRWLVIIGVNIQPSEFLKPAFVILIAWLFGESARRPEMPANTVALGLLLLVVSLLVLQPDFGQTMLIALVWGALFFMAGMRLIWVAGLAGIAALGLVGAYFTVPHVARRIKRFMDPAFGRHLQHRLCAGILRARRLVRPRPGRGHGQAHPAGKPHRLRLRGRRRGVRHRALPGAAALFAFIVIRALRHALATRTRSPALPPPASRSCSACSRPSTWRSTCT